MMDKFEKDSEELTQVNKAKEEEEKILLNRFFTLCNFVNEKC